MATVEVFDPPMCCSTGVCGPSVDPALAAFAADLSWLADQGVAVARHNLAQEPRVFAEHELVRALLGERGDEALPAVVVDGELRCSGRYPTRGELESWARTGATPTTLDAVTAELVALGAAVGANCEPCFTFHYDKARRLGVALETMTAVVQVAQTVKDAPARSILELAAKLLGTTSGALRTPPVAADTARAAETGVATGSAGRGVEESGPCCEAPVSAAAPVEAEAAAAGAPCCGDEAGSAEVVLTSSASVAGGGSGCCG